MLMGSVLHQSAFRGGVNARDAQAELGRMFARIVEIYDLLGTTERLTHLTLAMLCDVRRPHASFPSFKCKAAECRHLAPALAQLAAELCDGSLVSRRRRAALDALAAFYSIGDAEPMFMGAAASAASLECMEVMLKHYSWLRQEAERNGQLLYNEVPKCHFSWHLAYNNRFLNARYCWTYKCESWVGKVSHIAHSCCSGNALARIPPPLADKYRLLVHFRLSRGVHED